MRGVSLPLAFMLYKTIGRVTIVLLVWWKWSFQFAFVIDFSKAVNLSYLAPPIKTLLTETGGITSYANVKVLILRNELLQENPRMKRSTAKMSWKDGHFCCKQLSHFCKTCFSFVVLTYRKCPRIRPDILLTFNFSMAVFINVSFSLFFKMMEIPEFFSRFCFQKSTIRSSIIRVDEHLVKKITHWQNLKSSFTSCRL